ncbi:hypothetical protein N7456_009491 [Penicillium angulare]|uniref:Fe2OG dioxygenase domain-containing protein n=1 Tax=Penicillium angulare TaxID=116970 RepID=A0A9W9K5L9_9EURO|nr:hypothetical protein N7456_009491 [Penicillium angulare]
MTVNTIESEIEVPVIDISGYLQNDKTQTKDIVAAVRSACKYPGFFQITGHSVSADLRAQTLQSLQDFFGLPQDVKMQVHRTKSECFTGYEIVGEQKVGTGGDQKEGFMIGPEPFPGTSLEVANQWPEESVCPGLKGTFMQYYNEVRQLSKYMFRLLALSLDLEETYFDKFVASRDYQAMSMCKAHRYPPTTKEMADKTRGIGAHTDWGALTLLLQDEVGGLEVYYEPKDKWYPVKYVPDAYVVNIGDMMERWTNNRYKSTRHRVNSPVSGNYRYSIGLFNEGLLDQMLECIPTCLAEGEEPLHKPIKVETHLRACYEATY